VAVGPNGRIFVADSGNHRVQVFSETGEFVTTWGEFGPGPGQFNEPWGIAADDAFVYVADTWNHRIQKFSHEGEFIAAFGQNGNPNDVDGQGLGLFFGPRDLLLIDEDRLLVTDTGNHRMQLMTRDGDFLQQVGGFGGQLGQLNEPVGLAGAPNGDILAADTWNGRIQRFDPALFPIGQWPVDAWEGQSINNKPYLAADGAGRVYVTDPENFRVLIFNREGEYLARFGQFGSDSSGLGLPTGVTVDAQNNIYLADAGNNRVLKYAPIFAAPEPAAAEEAPADAEPVEEMEESISPTPTEQ
jgi:DNA-binding beta-propeller fold protein YncE